MTNHQLLKRYLNFHISGWIIFFSFNVIIFQATFFIYTFRGEFSNKKKYCKKKFSLNWILDDPFHTFQIVDGIYELPIGNFVHSAYRFRIGYSAESCNMQESQRGRIYDEYNLVFYRSCQLSMNFTLLQ